MTSLAIVGPERTANFGFSKNSFIISEGLLKVFSSIPFEQDKNILYHFLQEIFEARVKKKIFLKEEGKFILCF